MADKDQGFTLIELLVVIIIIGILAAIAIPVFLNQRKRAVDASLKSDLRHAAVIVDSWVVDNPGGPVLAPGTIESVGGPPQVVLKGIKLSRGNSMFLKPSIGTPGGWCLFAYNPNASEAIGWPDMAWRSLLGGLDPTLATVGSLCE